MINKNNKKMNNSKGFTLVETMVVVVVFSAVMSLALIIFLGSVRNQRTALAQQKLTMETTYALNRIENDIREGKINMNEVDVGKFRDYLSDHVKISNSDFKKAPSSPTSRITISVKTTMKVDENNDVSYRLQTTVVK